MASQEQGFAALKSRQIWTWRFAIFALINYAIAFTIVDVVPLPPTEMPWAILSELICMAIMLMLGIVVRIIVLSAPEEKTKGIWLNVTLFISVLFLTNFIGSPILHAQGEFGPSYWFEDIAIGLIGGVYIGLMYVSLFGVFQLQTEALQKLESTRDNLRDMLAGAQAQIQAHQDLLIKRTQDVLIPVIEDIKALLSSTRDSEKVLEKFKSVVYNEVSNMVSEARRIERLSSSLNSSTKAAKSTVHRLTVDFGRDLKPVRIWLTYLPGLLLALKLTEPLNAMIFSVLVSTILLALLALARRYFFPGVEVSVASAIGLIGSIAMVYTGIVSLLSQIWITSDDQAVVITATVYGTLVLTLTYTLVGARNRARAVTLGELANLTSKLEAASEGINRTLWVASMRWHSLLHGQVQSTLTRCILSLDPKKKISKKDREVILGLLEDISDLVNSDTRDNFDFIETVELSIDTWSGISAVYLEIDPAARHKLSEDTTLGFVLNELIKELISNLYTQFQSKEIDFSLHFSETGNFTLTATAYGGQEGQQTLDQDQFTKLNYLAPNWHFAQFENKLQIIATLQVADSD